MVGTATTVALVNYGFLKNFSPDFQYFSDYLTGTKNFTQAEVTQEIYPIVTYSNIVLTLVALLVIDILQYKPVIIFGTVAIISTKLMLYFGTSIPQMQLAELFYAVSKASNLAYNTYIYTQIDKEHYQYATVLIHISPNVGVFLSSLVGQILLSYKLTSVENLLQINIASLFLALLLSFTLPTPKNGSVKNNGTSTVCPQTKEQCSGSTYNKYKEKVVLLWKEFKSTYTNPYLLMWCGWMVVSFGVIEMVLQYYAQALWSEVGKSKENVNNGLVEAIYMVFSMTGSYIIGKVEVNWMKDGDMILAFLSFLKGASILAASYCKSLVWAYFHYIVYTTISDISLVLYRAEMAKHLENFGLIFGINMFFSNCLQSFVTFLLTSKQGLALSIRDQFFVVAWCFIVLGGIFVIKWITSGLLKSKGLYMVN